MKASLPKNTETVGSESLFKNIFANKQQQLQQEFEALALPLMDRLYSMALRVTRDQLDAEDLVQNTYLKAWFYCASFKSGSNFQGWIFQILINHFLNDCRNEKRMPFHADYETIRALVPIEQTSEADNGCNQSYIENMMRC